MKYKILLLVIIMGCKSKSQQFEKFEIDAGAITPMTVSGSFGSSGTEEWYWFVPLGIMDINFIVFNVKYKDNHRDEAAKLFDSLMVSRRYDDVIGILDSPESNYSEERKKEIREYYSLRWAIRKRFNDHIRLYVEKEAVKTGISYKSYIKYE